MMLTQLTIPEMSACRFNVGFIYEDKATMTVRVRFEDAHLYLLGGGGGW